MRRFAPPRGLNRFVREAVAAKVAELEAADLERELIEGYLATRVDRDELNTDWEVVDLEDWPQY